LPPNSSVHMPETLSTSFPSGGGFSNNFAAPDYQKSAIASYYANYAPPYGPDRYNDSRAARGYPDVVVNGQDYAVAINGSFVPISGTSASSPTMGAIVALINGARKAKGKGPVG